MQTARNAVATIAQVLISAVLLLILYKMILGALGADRLGIWSIVLATASASRIGELGLSASVTRFVAKYRAEDQHAAVGEVIQTAALSIAAFLAVLLYPIYLILLWVFEYLFVDGAYIEATRILPYALVSLLLTAVAAVFQSGLDGYRRYDRRAILVIGAQISLLVGAWLLIPGYGLLGLAWAQVIQGAILVIAGWALVRISIVSLPAVPHIWRKRRFLEILNYGMQVQIGMVFRALFEPLTKALLGKFGGLAAAGYFEMARQFVGKARQTVVSANQVVIPLVASLKANDVSELNRVYRANLELLIFFIVPLFAAVVSWTPILSEYWIGRYEEQFVMFADVLVLSMGVNAIAGPAYFASLGTGRLIWNTIGHVEMGVLNLLLSLYLGPRFGVTGVIAAFVIAWISGSVIIIGGFQRTYSIGWDALFPRSGAVLLLVATLSMVGGIYSYEMLLTQSAWIRTAVCLALPVLVLFPAIWAHPQRSKVQKAAFGIYRA